MSPKNASTNLTNSDKCIRKAQNYIAYTVKILQILEVIKINTTGNYEQSMHSEDFFNKLKSTYIDHKFLKRSCLIFK